MDYPTLIFSDDPRFFNPASMPEDSAAIYRER